MCYFYIRISNKICETTKLDSADQIAMLPNYDKDDEMF